MTDSEKHNTPPKLPLQFFRWFCRPDILEDIEGDLVENFNEKIHSEGMKSARRYFLWQVLLLFRPGIIDSTLFRNQMQYTMFKHNLKISWRILRKNKLYSSINIVGLALALMVAIYITLWIRGERSFDAFHPDVDNIYQVMRHSRFGDDVYTGNAVPYLLGDVLKNDPAIDQVSMASDGQQRSTLVVGDLTHKSSGYYADPEFFNLFDWSLQAGSQPDLLRDPSSIMISSSLARQFFREDEEILGKSINVDNQRDYSIVGVFEDVPYRSSLQFDFILPVINYRDRSRNNLSWGNSAFQMFVRVDSEEDLPVIDQRIRRAQDIHLESFSSEIFLHSFTDRHLNSTFRDGKLVAGSLSTYIAIFIIVGIFILVIAGINFVNLNIARSLKRSREVGVRKSIGASRSSLFGQFMWESAIMASAALVLATVMVIAFLPQFNAITGQTITISDFSFNTLSWLGVIGGLTIILSGVYPALYLSSVSILQVLKGVFKPSGKHIGLRKGLILVQYVLSLLLILGTLAVHKQIQFIQQRNLGLDRNQVLSVSITEDLNEHFAAFKSELEKHPGIESVSRASSSPLDVGSNTYSVQWPGYSGGDEHYIHVLRAGPDLTEVLKMEIVEGHDFKRYRGTEQPKYIINQQLQQMMKVDDPVGKQFTLWNKPGEIVGVVRDFHMKSLYDPIEPTLISLSTEGGLAYMRLSGMDLEHTLDYVDQSYQSFESFFPLEYRFLDDDFNATYKNEELVGKLSAMFTFFALCIAGLGLLGLAIFISVQRIKEVSIRKILGATLTDIILLLSRDFIMLIVLAIVIATPIFYWLVGYWLEGFAYHTKIGAGLFMVSGIGTLLIAFIIVGIQSWKVATENPVNSIKVD